MLGSGEGTNGAGGPGILHTFGMLFLAMPFEPLVMGVLGGCTVTLAMVPPLEHCGATQAALRAGADQSPRSLRPFSCRRLAGQNDTERPRGRADVPPSGSRRTKYRGVDEVSMQSEADEPPL